MLKLMQNELEKISKWKIFFIWLISLGFVAFITSIILMGLGTNKQITTIVTQNIQFFDDQGNVWAGWPIVASLFGLLFTKAIFLVFEAYFISALVIDEFKKKTINQLFSYPIEKSKIIWSKILVIVIISLVTQYSAVLIVELIIKLLAMLTGFSYSITLIFLVILFFITSGIVLIGLLPMVFGMIKYSTVITMLSSVMIAAVISNAVPGTLANSPMNNLLVLAVAGIVSLIIVAVSISKIVKKDAILH